MHVSAIFCRKTFVKTSCKLTRDHMSLQGGLLHKKDIRVKSADMYCDHIEEIEEFLIST